jgi:hypothetical protein
LGFGQCSLVAYLIEASTSITAIQITHQHQWLPIPIEAWDGVGFSGCGSSNALFSQAESSWYRDTMHAIQFVSQEWDHLSLQSTCSASITIDIFKADTEYFIRSNQAFVCPYSVFMVCLK